jgi:hypothetical protein
MGDAKRHFGFHSRNPSTPGSQKGGTECVDLWARLFGIVSLFCILAQNQEINALNGHPPTGFWKWILRWPSDDEKKEDRLRIGYNITSEL